MNAYIKAFAGKIAITSIGLDGEEIDQVTFQEKPQIEVQPGYLIGTASNTLRNFTCDFEVLLETDIETSIGKVVIVRVKSIGKALVAGPAKVNEMCELIQQLKKYDIDKILIDGAFSRQVFAKLTQATILVVGANYSQNIDSVVRDALFTIKKFNLQSIDLPELIDEQKICFIDRSDNIIKWHHSTIIGNIEEFFTRKLTDVKSVYFPKAITNKYVEKLIESRKKCKFDIILDSPVNIQLDESHLENIFKLENKLYVLNPINLALICYNPYSPRGYSFDSKVFKDKLEEALNFEVFNVLKDGQNE
jgi:hypothetical protein